MSFTVYKPGPVTANRTMAPPAIIYSRPASDPTSGQLYANASLMTQLKDDANRLSIKHNGERLDDDNAIPVLILIDRDSRRLGLAAAVEGDRNAVMMRLNKSRKGVIPGGVRLAKSLGMAGGLNQTDEITEHGVLVRTITYGDAA